MKREPVLIAIADDHNLVREGIVRVLKDHPNVEISFQAKNGQELLTALHSKKADIVILDIVMPGMDGRDIIEIIKSTYNKIKIIVVSAQEDDNLVAKYVKLGADGFLPKTGEVLELLKAIDSIVKDGFYFQDKVLEMLNQKGIHQAGGIKQLTAQEIKILKLLCENKSPTEISDIMNIKKNNLGYLKHRVFQKTNTTDIKGLQEYAFKHIFS